MRTWNDASLISNIEGDALDDQVPRTACRQRLPLAPGSGAHLAAPTAK